MTQVVGAGTAPPGGPGQPSLRSRIRWRVADQVLSSLTVVGLSFVVARSVEAHIFGIFGVVLLLAGFALGITRAMVSDVFLIQFGDAVPGVRRQAARNATGAAVALGLAAGTFCCLVSAVLPGQPIRTAVFAVGLALPGLLVQDCFRLVFIAAGRPRPALLLGLSGAAVQLTVVVLLTGAGHHSMVGITAGWGAAALLSAGIGCLLARLTPSLREVPLWFALNRHLTVRLSIDYLLGLGSLYLAYCLIGGVVGIAAIGALWAAQMFLVPAYLVISGTSALLRAPFAARAERGQGLLRPALLTGLGLGVVTALWGVALTAVPEWLGMHLSGQSWDGASDVLEPAVIGVVMAGLGAGPVLALRARGRLDALRRAWLVRALLLLVLGTVGADLHGVRGAAIGLVAAHVIGAIALWAQFLRNSAQPVDPVR
ncbi:membrane protein [Kineosporia mesophila]|uniref:Membrane protein n=1 Tax=Kineosporia mesophila TaxID=566012 RepID=A0ABP7A2U6_9ACTN|nr:hypothetical protein [Kineosporia mesophila]MCD5349018.1 hypothetical protein [Kineosporia mesophila]